MNTVRCRRQLINMVEHGYQEPEREMKESRKQRKN